MLLIVSQGGLREARILSPLLGCALNEVATENASFPLGCYGIP
jgi:hypothetical protein